MVTVGEALLWRVDSLDALARVLRSGARALADSADGSQGALNALSKDDFAGDNRSAAETSVTHSSTRLRRSSVALERLAACCSDTAAMLNDVIRELTDAVNQATNLGFQVNLVSSGGHAVCDCAQPRSSQNPCRTFHHGRMACNLAASDSVSLS